MRTSGWIIFIAALGMMLGLLAGDVSQLNKWGDTLYPSFIAGVMTHISAVIAAFVGGNLVPNMFRSSNASNRVSDAKRNEISAGV